MRVALLSGNAPRHNAIGNQIAEKVRFFQERGAEVRVFVHDVHRLHAALQSCCTEVAEPTATGPVWDYLRHADIVFAVYAQYHDLLRFLPCLAGTGPRIVFDYYGVTPAEYCHDASRESLDRDARQRGHVWCADHALTTSQANRRELLRATNFPPEHVATLPLLIDTERFAPEPSERYLQERLGIDGPILLYVGRIAGNKRLPLLIESVARLQDARVHAVFVGDTTDIYAEEAARCLALARDLGISNRIHFTGQLDDTELAQAYRSADVLVMPSVHEGFCVPVLEAMACGVPVLASRSAALPETLGAAGLTFEPGNVNDLVRQIRRVLLTEFKPAGEVLRTRGLEFSQRRMERRRVAIVCFRFGLDIVGGAETSLRIMARALAEARQHVEVFTTCTTTESHWRNELTPGTTTIDGLTVHRFPIAPHDAEAHGTIVRTILEADGRVDAEVEKRYLECSIHAPSLIAALTERRDDFDAVITGPYLFGLSADVAAACGDRTLLVPCFHDESLARLAIWQKAYGAIGGVLFHTGEEQEFAQAELGINHPNAHVTGTCLANRKHNQPRRSPVGPLADKSYVVYCGRYSRQKNVPLLVEWARRFEAEKPGRLAFVFMGQGDEKLPAEPWLHDLGHVDEATKRTVLAGAKALVQLSTQESLSLVALEAWAEGTPIVVHRDCAVLTGQIERAQGGRAVGAYAEFAAALDELCADEAGRRRLGANGRAYVEAHYASPAEFAARLIDSIDRVRLPIATLMRSRGLERAREYGRDRWQRRFAEFVEQVLTQPARPCRAHIEIEPMRSEARIACGTRTLLLPVRLTNAGTHAAAPDGPGRTVVCCEVRDEATGAIVAPRSEIGLPALLRPGQAQATALPIPAPADIGEYRIALWCERRGAEHVMSNMVDLPLTIAATSADNVATCASAFLDTVRETLPETHRLQRLPDDYVDVTEGAFAPAKKWIKRKLLHNFKHAYVDVMSRRQSQVNTQVVQMIQQLTECCAMLDHAVAGLHQRLDAMEAKLESRDSLLATPDSESEVRR